MMDATQQPSDLAEQRMAKVQQVEVLISTILRIGVITSLSIVVLGTVISFAHHPSYRAHGPALDRLTTPGAADFPRTLAQAWHGIRHFQGQAIVTAGLLLLIATPVVRVAVSILAFFHERDWPFVFITALVLALLLLSFFLGKAEA